MPTELTYPFSIAADGTIATTTDPDVQIGQHVEALIATQPGERLFLPAYGVPVLDQVFADSGSMIANLLTGQVETALETYEPGVFVQSVTPSSDDAGTAKIDVKYTRREAANSASSLSRNVNTATVRVGGTVSEQIQG